jgi:putative membrane protein
VKTGKIFGAYQYGYALGPKLAGVPLIIGVNWVIMVLCSMAVADLVKMGELGKSVLGAALMTGLDFLIEQMAPIYHFWYFDRLEVPLRNYLAWFVLGFFFQYLGRQLGVNTSNALARPIFVMLTLFFLILSVVNFFS